MLHSHPVRRAGEFRLAVREHDVEWPVRVLPRLRAVERAVGRDGDDVAARRHARDPDGRLLVALLRVLYVREAEQERSAQRGRESEPHAARSR